MSSRRGKIHSKNSLLHHLVSVARSDTLALSCTVGDLTLRKANPKIHSKATHRCNTEDTDFFLTPVAPKPVAKGARELTFVSDFKPALYTQMSNIHLASINNVSARHIKVTLSNLLIITKFTESIK